MIRVVIADDHAIVRAGLEQVLATTDDVVVVGTAGNGAEAAAVVDAVSPDVVLMDLSMPEVDGIAATRAIVESGSTAQIVVLTSFSDQKRILEVLDAGAIGYLLKDAEPSDLLAGIRAAARGESPLAPKAASALLQARSERSLPPSDQTDLSAREREVLALVAQGHSNKAIARKLDISEKTVKTHLTSIFRRIGVFDRTQAALWAQRQGIRAEPTS